MEKNTCQHLASIGAVKTSEQRVCEECVKIGGRWVHLRTCQSCGVTLCCNSSPHRHATAHFHEVGHPVVASAEPGERWLWCYEDELFGEY